jgi:hypothetical protein
MDVDDQTHSERWDATHMWVVVDVCPKWCDGMDGMIFKKRDVDCEKCSYSCQHLINWILLPFISDLLRREARRWFLIRFAIVYVGLLTFCISCRNGYTLRYPPADFFCRYFKSVTGTYLIIITTVVIVFC